MSELKFSKLFRLTKVDEGNHVIAGMVTAETPDKSGEICDYEDSKPLYREWSEEIFNATVAAEQEPSLGNVRLQHSLMIAGKITKLIFDDDKRQINVETQPVDDKVFDLAKRGFITGFSHAGGYRYRRCNTCKSDIEGDVDDFHCNKCGTDVLVRYCAKPSEVSYVDNPCHASAHFSLVKADGSIELRKFAEKAQDVHIPGPTTDAVQPVLPGLTADPNPVPPAPVAKVEKKEPRTKRVAGEDLPSSAFAYVGDPEKTDTWHYPIKFSTEEKTKSHIRNALGQWNKPNGQVNIPESERSKVRARIVSAARRHGIEVGSDSKKGATMAELRKDMYHISTLASLLQQIRYLQSSVSSEGEWEDDERDAVIADGLGDWLKTGVGILKQVVEDETSELIATKAVKSTPKGVVKMDELLKAARKGLAAHFRKAAAHALKMADVYKSLSEEHAAATETHKAACDHYTAKCDGEGDKEHFKTKASTHKALGAHHKSLASSYEKAMKAASANAEHLAKMAEENEEEPPAKKIEPVADLKKDATVTEPPPAVQEPPAVPVPPAAAPLTLESITSAITSSISEAFKAAIPEMQKAFGEKKADPEPVAVKVAGPQLIARNGEVVAPAEDLLEGTGL